MQSSACTKLAETPFFKFNVKCNALLCSSCQCWQHMNSYMCMHEREDAKGKRPSDDPTPSSYVIFNRSRSIYPSDRRLQLPTNSAPAFLFKRAHRQFEGHGPLPICLSFPLPPVDSRIFRSSRVFARLHCPETWIKRDAVCGPWCGHGADVCTVPEPEDIIRAVGFAIFRYEDAVIPGV